MIDGAHNDSRMNVTIALTAALHGATVLNHAEVTKLIKDENGRITGVEIKDLIPPSSSSPSSYTVHSKGVINATGPFTDSIRALDGGPSTSSIVSPSSGVHIVLPGYYSPAKMGLIDPNTSDGRVIFFLPWQGNTIAGTTDSPTTITPNPIPTESEISWILSEVARYLSPEITVRREDVLAAWSGIRPLVTDPAAKNTESLVRNHLINISPTSGLLTIAGGKWTTYRQMAEETVDAAIREFNLKPKRGCVTEHLKLVGADGFSKTLFINLIQYFHLPVPVAQHLASNYGDRAWTVASLSSPNTPIELLAPGTNLPFVVPEIRYAVRHEYAQSAVDVLARRTRLAFLNVLAALEALPKVIDVMGEELGWDQGRKQEEWKRSVAFLNSMGLESKRLNVTRGEVEKGCVEAWRREVEKGRIALKENKGKQLGAEGLVAGGGV